MKLAIADPPYPPQIAERRDRPGGPIRTTFRSRAQRYYSNDGVRSQTDRQADHHDAASEWDDPARHRALLEDLRATYDGWAIATTPDGIRHYEPLPIPCRLLVWWKEGKPGNHRIASSWEAVIVYPPETRRGRLADGQQVPDVLRCKAPNIGFSGAKPAAWTRWVLDALGYNPDDDELVDLFPGSGSIAAAAAQGVLL